MVIVENKELFDTWLKCAKLIVKNQFINLKELVEYTIKFWLLLQAAETDDDKVQAIIGTINSYLTYKYLRTFKISEAARPIRMFVKKQEELEEKRILEKDDGLIKHLLNIPKDKIPKA